MSEFNPKRVEEHKQKLSRATTVGQLCSVLAALPDDMPIAHHQPDYDLPVKVIVVRHERFGNPFVSLVLSVDQ